MEMTVISPRLQFVLFLLLEGIIGCCMWLGWRDQPAPILEVLGSVGSLLSWIPLPLYLYYKFRPKSSKRWQWLFPDNIGLTLGWTGYFMRQEAVVEKSWTLANSGSILEILGGLAVIYALVVLFRLPKNER